jgi:hypothetical protein
MDGTSLKVHTKERRLKCLLMPFGKVQKFIHKMRKSGERNAELYVFNVTLDAEEPAKLHLEEELITANERQRL